MFVGIGGVETGASPAGSVTARVKTRPRLVRASLRVTSTFRRPSAAVAHLDARGPTPTLFSSAVTGAGADRAAARRAVDGLHDPEAVETAAGAARADIAIPPVSPGRIEDEELSPRVARRVLRSPLCSPSRGCEVLEGNARV